VLYFLYVLYFPLENIVLEILLRIRCNKQLKYRLCSCTTGNIAHRRGLGANIALSFASCYISLSTTPLHNISCNALCSTLTRIDGIPITKIGEQIFTSIDIYPALFKSSMFSAYFLLFNSILQVALSLNFGY